MEPASLLHALARRTALMPAICNKCGQPCDVIEIDDPCWNEAGASLGYQPSHGESFCCRAHYHMEPANGQTIDTPPPPVLDTAGSQSNCDPGRCCICGDHGGPNNLIPADALMMHPASGCHQACIGQRNGVWYTWMLWHGVGQKRRAHSDQNSAEQAYEANCAIANFFHRTIKTKPAEPAI